METKSHRPMCPTPFTTLIFNPNGDVGTCRELTNHHIVGNIFEQSLEEIWNGEKLKNLRNEFISGNIKTCLNCISYRNCHMKGDNRDFLDIVDFSEIQKNPPIKISPDFNGRCNLKCNMCDIWKLPNGLYENSTFIKFANKHIYPHLKVMEPLGGEPFIQPQTYELINLMAKINPRCKWNFTTNAHWHFNNAVKKHLDRIYSGSIMISLDGATEETYHTIRGGKFDLVIETVKDLVRYTKTRRDFGMKPLNLSLAMTVQKYNWFEMHLFAKLAGEIGVDEYHYQETVGDDKYDGNDPLVLSKLDEKFKIEICEYMISSLPVRALHKAKEIYFPIANSLCETNKNMIIKMYYAQMVNHG